ncbi:MAG: DUF1853 family protein [Aureliella sp.]
MQESERYVRDLIWAVSSPPLVQLAGHDVVPAQQLRASDVDREELTRYFKEHPPRRVGSYFEQLIAYWIHSIRRCEIVSQSMQLHDGTRTLGEIDLLFRDEQGRLNHWELACKFYLQTDTVEQATSEYVGPNANDTLGKKIRRLVEHQLPLGRHHFPEIERQAAFVKGQIFYHWQTVLPESHSVQLAENHLSGHWLRAREVPELASDESVRYRVLRKPFWLADDVASPADKGVLTAENMVQYLHGHFRTQDSPLLISRFPPSQLSATESQRLFIVPDDWPAIS